MKKYKIILSKEADNDILIIKNSGRKIDYKRIKKFLLEIEENPRTGTGKPERLKYNDGEIWSREINRKDRLIYEVVDDEIIVFVLRALGHYNDK
jgi:toxin YoeB